MKKVILLLIFLPLILLGRKDEDLDSLDPGSSKPWFTGPLLTPSGHVIPTGHQNFEPYAFWTPLIGRYDQNWHSSKIPRFNIGLLQLTTQIGILPATEFNLAPQFTYNNTQGVHAWHVSDLPIALGFQLYQDNPHTWYPAVKLRLGLNIPIGKYDKLKLDKLGTDAGGIGNWFPNVGLVFSRATHISGLHFFAWRFFAGYFISTPVHVHGLNFYGGAPSLDGIKGTRGTVYPGNMFLALFGMEYSLTQNWALAFDFQYQHNNHTRFSGHSPLGTKPTSPSREQFSIAPAIEYNFNANIGLIAGAWFTVAGRNSVDFVSWVFAINIYN